MTTSRSTGFRNSGALLAITIATAIVLGGAGTAIAGRHRVVILEFKGPNAAKFHADVVKIVRKSHTVVGIEKWENAADDLGATKINSKNVKRVAQKLNVDGVIIGEVEKRRDRYILRIKVREGRSGDYTGNPIEATSGDARLDARSTRDLRGELLDTIDTLDPAVSARDDDDDRGRRARDDDDDDDRGRRARDDDEEDDRASRGKDRGKTRGKGRDSEDEDAEDDGGSRGKSGFSSKGDRRGRDQVDEDDEDDEDTGSKAKAKAKARGKGKSLADDDDMDEDDRGSRGKDRGDPRTSDGDDDENPLGASKSKAKGAGKAKAKGGDKDDEEDADVRVASSDDDDEDDGDRRARDDEGDDEGDGDGEDRVAARDDDDDGGEDNEVRDADTGEEPEDDGIDHTSVANRAIDAVIGLSVMRRTLSFQTEAGLADAPQGYRGAPVAGFYLDADLYPLALSKKNRSITKDIGVTVLADRVIKISSNVGGVKLASKQYRYGVGVVFRYPIGPALLTARLRYSKMGFSIARDGVMVDVPDVDYTVIDPGLGIVYPFGKLAIGLDAAFMAIPSTGKMQDASQYGGATVTGFDAEAHVDYLITSKIFARAAFHFVTIGLKFKGNGAMTTDRDADADQDVFSARDTYLGGFISGGYLF
jgi:hypothetical protein